ncbi:hypothetical protein COL05_15790 [Bacillus sp. AFS059628]|nr:hypothetical protein COL05_15790 [Bacillus sp. AFS059628]
MQKYMLTVIMLFYFISDISILMEFFTDRTNGRNRNGNVTPFNRVKVVGSNPIGGHYHKP